MQIMFLVWGHPDVGEDLGILVFAGKTSQMRGKGGAGVS
mgnify:CR=1 FL=1